MSNASRISRGWFFNIGKWRLGAEYSPIYDPPTGELYMRRWILYVGPINLRLHKFFRGDDGRAPHDHPFSFITFPFSDYYEWLPVNDHIDTANRVRAWRFHYRPATYKHIVDMEPGSKPFWTFVIAGPYARMWGFWPDSKTFIPWREWK